MRQVRHFTGAMFIVSVFFINSSCSQPSSAVGSQNAEFTATTPSTDAAKKMLGISVEFKTDMMRWRLTMDQGDGLFTLTCQYGIARQGSKGFMDGSKSVELKGKYTQEKGTSDDPDAIVYKLIAENSPVVLFFMEPDPNLLHLLDEKKQLMVGTGAWSYTLNRVIKVAPVAHLSISKKSTPRIIADSSVVGVFDGRTPCNSDFTELNGISMAGCQIIKFRLILYQDLNTHLPSKFQMFNVYVGKGGTRYSVEGNWKMTLAAKDGRDVIIYSLEPASGKQLSISFLKADDNVLFLVDKQGHFLVGDEYTSYTLNRSKNN